MMTLLAYVVAAAVCSLVVWGGLRLLVAPLLWWTRRQLRHRVLARDCDLQDRLWVQGDPRGTYGWPHLRNLRKH